MGGKSKYIQVTAHAKIKHIPDKQAEWINPEECVKGQTDPNAKAWTLNHVAMDPDSDGEENNWACIPVTKPRPIKVTKTDLYGAAVVGAEFVIYPDNHGKPDTENPVAVNVNTTDTGQSTNNYTSEPLAVNRTYWLVETKAPASHELLAKPKVSFELTDTGIVLRDVNGQPTTASTVGGGAFELVEGDKFAITVKDPRAMELPKSGGYGQWPYALLGMVLVGVAIVMTTRKTSGVSVRSS